jgi:hypothetical protein
MHRTGSATGGISGLTPGTIYFFRAAATNSAGTTWAPASASFATTAVTPPSITNSETTSINGTFATLNGEVTDAGGDPPTVNIFYGTTDGGSVPGDWQFSNSAGNQSGIFSRLVTNLQPTTTYFFRAFAQNAAGGRPDGRCVANHLKVRHPLSKAAPSIVLGLLCVLAAAGVWAQG